MALFQRVQGASNAIMNSFSSAVPTCQCPDFTTGNQHPYAQHSEQNTLLPDLRTGQTATFCLPIYLFPTNSLFTHFSWFSPTFIPAPSPTQIKAPGDNQSLQDTSVLSENRPDPPHRWLTCFVLCFFRQICPQ